MKIFAYLVRRFFAFGGDWYLSAVLINLVANGVSRLIPYNDGIYYAIIISSVLVPFIYYIIVPLKLWKGQTLLMRMMYLRIEGEVNLKTLLIRYFVGCLLLEGVFYQPSVNIRECVVFLNSNLATVMSYVNIAMIVCGIISLVLALLDSEGKFRFLHDRIVGTYVDTPL